MGNHNLNKKTHTKYIIFDKYFEQNEDDIKIFLDSVIAKGLGENNSRSYVLSVYINHNKCFAFVELKNIELTTACLDLDGIIYKKIIMKILRANGKTTDYTYTLYTLYMLYKLYTLYTL